MSEQEDREALYDLWSRHGSSWESDSSEGRELADAIVAAGCRRPEPVTPERVARMFHEAYEVLAPSFGYETRKESAVEWDKVPEPNRSLVIAVAGKVLEALGRPVIPSCKDSAPILTRPADVEDSLTPEPVTPETDQRILAWERIVRHPAFKPCFRDGKLIDHMMKRLDDLVELEATVNELAPAPVTPEPDEFRKAVVRERVRQIKKGYTAEHDADHGPDHLIRLAINYAARGKSVQAAAVMEALRDLLAHPPVTPETETEWEYGTGLNGPRGYRRTAGVPAVPPGPWLLEENWGV